MLTLARHAGERITIIVPPSTTPTKITVMQVETAANKSRLGFDAPREVRILRDEVLERAEAQ